MGVAVGISYDQWIASFPEFQGITQTQFNICYGEAQIFHRNDGGGPVRTGMAQTTLLLLMISHICQIQFGTPGNPASPNDPVGRVTNAGEGSVSVGFENSFPPGTPQWFQQTKYGAMYWTATAVYRTMRYMPGHGRPLSPFFFR